MHPSHCWVRFMRVCGHGKDISTYASDQFSLEDKKSAGTCATLCAAAALCMSALTATSLPSQRPRYTLPKEPLPMQAPERGLSDGNGGGVDSVDYLDVPHCGTNPCAPHQSTLNNNSNRDSNKNKVIIIQSQ